MDGSYESNREGSHYDDVSSEDEYELEKGAVDRKSDVSFDRSAPIYESIIAKAPIPSHPMLNYKTKLCRYFASGNCSNLQCNYAHGEDELAPWRRHKWAPGELPSDEPHYKKLTSKRLNNDYKVKLCKEFMTDNHCASGAFCYYAHGPDDLTPAIKAIYKTRVCPDWVKGSVCPRRACCLRAHGLKELKTVGTQKKKKKLCPSTANKTKCRDKDCKLSHDAEDMLVKCPYLEKSGECLRLRRYGKCPYLHEDADTEYYKSVADEIPYSTYKIRLCVDYTTTGTCEKGEMCTYAHGVKDLSRYGRTNYKKKLCHHWETGLVCPRGPEKCSFAHGTEELILDEEYEGELCPDLKEGRKCQRGDRCSFEHLESPLTLREKKKKGGGDFNPSKDVDVDRHAERDKPLPKKPTQPLMNIEPFDLKKRPCPKEKANLMCERVMTGDCPYAHKSSSIPSTSTTKPKSSNGPLGRCDLCNVTVSGADNMELHLNGKKHKSVVATKRAEEAAKRKSKPSALLPTPNASNSDATFLMGSIASSAFSPEVEKPESKLSGANSKQGRNSKGNEQNGKLYEYRSNRKKRICKYLDKGGNCHNGQDKCPYAHGLEELSDNDPSGRGRNLFNNRERRSSPRSRSRSRSGSRGGKRRRRSPSRSRSTSSSRSRGSASRTVLRKTGKGDWKVRDADDDEDDDSQPLIFELLTLEEKKDLDKAHKLVEFAQSCLDSDGGVCGNDLSSSKSSSFLKAYDEAMNALKKLRKEIRLKQRKLPRKVVKDALDAQADYAMSGVASTTVEPATSNEIDYLEATTLDTTPLNLPAVEAYFSRFGSLMWCLQAGSNSTVIFKYHDVSLYKMALDFNHLVDGKTLRLQGMKNGGIPVDPKSTGAVTSVVTAPASIAAPVASPAKSTGKDDGAIDADYLASLTPEQFARYINSIR